MDAAMVWLTGCAAVASIVSAWIAVVQAVRAERSKREAKTAEAEAVKARDEALALTQRIADANETQAAASLRSAPGEWAPLRRTTHEGVALQNTTGQAAVIEDISLVNPAARAKIYFNHRKLPANLDHGDVFEFMVYATAGQPELEISWHPVGDEVSRTTRRTPPAKGPAQR